MKEFRSFDNTIKVTLGDATFEGDPARFEMYVGNLQKAIGDLAKKIDGGLATDEIIEEGLKEMAELTDTLFGEGSIPKMLGRNNVSFHDFCDIYTYCKKAAHEFELTKQNFYRNAYNSNYNRNKKRK